MSVSDSLGNNYAAGINNYIGGGGPPTVLRIASGFADSWSEKP